MRNIVLDSEMVESLDVRDINRKLCGEKYDDLREKIKNGEIILSEMNSYPIGMPVWILEYGDIPTKTTIRKKDYGIKWAENYDENGILPWVEWRYYVRGNRKSYFEDELYRTRRDAELALAKKELNGFISKFGNLVKQNKFTKEDFPELNVGVAKMLMLEEK